DSAARSAPSTTSSASTSAGKLALYPSKVSARSTSYHRSTIKHANTLQHQTTSKSANSRKNGTELTGMVLGSSRFWRESSSKCWGPGSEPRTGSEPSRRRDSGSDPGAKEEP
ncbi:unnamed protein product, partial [Linum tenue]